MLKTQNSVLQNLLRRLPPLAPAGIRPLSSLNNKSTLEPFDNSDTNLNKHPTTSELKTTAPKPIPLEALKKAPQALHTLHARLRLDDASLPLATLARALICASARSQYVDNAALARFGTGVLRFVAFDYIVSVYPRLPSAVAEVAVEVLLAEHELAVLAEREWGVEEDSHSALARYLEEDAEGLLLGKLRYGVARPLSTDGTAPSSQEIHDSRQTALATFVRALVAGVYAHGGLAAAHEFARTYVVAPSAAKVDLATIIATAAGPQPVRELVSLCAREGMTSPISRLLTEAPTYSEEGIGSSADGSSPDAYSASPLFVVGIFSDKKQLGQAQATTVAEAKHLASLNALTQWYLAPHQG